MIARIQLEVPGDPEPRSLELADGEGAVVGREPEPSGRSPGASRSVVVASPRVSANHVSIRHAGGAMTVVDQHSRNGTWLRLPPGDPVVVRSEQPVVLRLGSLTQDRVNEPLADAEWTSRDDFHLGIVTAVTTWFERQHVQARVTAIPRDAATSRERPEQIALANGFDLALVPLMTMDNRWDRLAETLAGYAAAQNLIFTTEEHARGEGMVLVSPAIRRVHRSVVEAAQRGIRVLLFGPSGVGKDGLARCYHRNSGRDGAFVAKNCSMFTREFLRVELFGADKGAYTGATRNIVGAVERAHAGTLFLDEIGELPAEVQAMLLTFLDRGEYERFGGTGVVRTADVRIVSATNRDLRGGVRARGFREDLWYRIAGQVIEVPPLSDRPQDVEAYLQRARLSSGISVHAALSAASRQRLAAHHWPGNFRELMSFVAQVPPAAAEESIDVAACEAILRRVSVAPAGADPPRPSAPAAGKIDVARLAGVAAEAFRADFAHELACWDDVKQYVESYLKPLLFAGLSGVASGAVGDIAGLAHAVDADRGTVRKHLARYLERFSERPRKIE